MITVVIDNIDISEYGAYFMSGIDSLLQFPSSKKPNTQEWYEYDGLDVELSTGLRLHAQTVNLSFLLKDKQSYDHFMAKLKDKSVLNFSFSFQDMNEYTYQLRLEEIKASVIGDKVIATCRMSQDNPIPQGTQHYPEPTYTGEYRIDGINMSIFEAKVLQGWADQVNNQGGIKEPVIFDGKYNKGIKVIGDNAMPIRYDDIRIQVLIHSHSLQELFENRDELLTVLIRPGARRIKLKNYEFDCYYKSCNNVEFDINNRWWKFNLIFVKINASL